MYYRPVCLNEWMDGVVCLGFDVLERSKKRQEDR